ncbi:MAG: hypothetical protein WBI41_05960 [Azovibrio sp.]|uniref:hypothetical protein n=1 Tax=Azovibrio sp. TaxID=1872673 RepID=UPI003C745989
MKTLDAPYLSASAPGWSATKAGGFSRVEVTHDPKPEPESPEPDGWYSTSAIPNPVLKGCQTYRKKFKDRGALQPVGGSWVDWSLDPSGRGEGTFPISRTSDQNPNVEVVSFGRSRSGGRRSSTYPGSYYFSYPDFWTYLDLVPSGARMITRRVGDNPIFHVCQLGPVIDNMPTYIAHSFSYLLDEDVSSPSDFVSGITAGYVKTTKAKPRAYWAFLNKEAELGEGQLYAFELNMELPDDGFHSPVTSVVMSPNAVFLWTSEAVLEAAKEDDYEPGWSDEDAVPEDMICVRCKNWKVLPPKGFLFLNTPGGLQRVNVDMSALYPDLYEEGMVPPKDDDDPTAKDHRVVNVHNPTSLAAHTKLYPLTARRALARVTYQDSAPDLNSDMGPARSELLKLTKVKLFIFDVYNGAAVEIDTSFGEFVRDQSHNPVADKLEKLDGEIVWDFMDHEENNYNGSKRVFLDDVMIRVIGEGSFIAQKVRSNRARLYTDFGSTFRDLTIDVVVSESVVVGHRTDDKPDNYIVVGIKKPPGFFIAEGADVPGTSSRTIRAYKNDFTEFEDFDTLSESVDRAGDYTYLVWVGSRLAPAPRDPCTPFRLDVRFDAPDWFIDGVSTI